MGLKEIKENLLQAAELVGDFEANGMEIDRDVALDKIRAAYESLRFLYEEAAHETINKGDEDSEVAAKGKNREGGPGQNFRQEIYVGRVRKGHLRGLRLGHPHLPITCFFQYNHKKIIMHTGGLLI